MSANNYLKIKKWNRKWIVEHWDCDCGKHGDKFPKFNTLEEAVKEANKFEKKCNEEGYGVEYGLRIIPS